MVKLYNTLTRKLEPFNPQDPANVKIYTCGPTVYNYQHIGNYTSYIYWDLLLRTLIANGYTPRRILNLTDVGHLTSDADHGEDKLEKGARREGKTVWEIADFYIDDFLTNFRVLNLLEPAKITRATDYIKESKALVDTLSVKNYTYETSDGIYFDTSKFPSYADFARLDLKKLQAGARVEFNTEKRHASDFAVWKFVQPGEDHAMQWDYQNRPGYPGWHLECSTIIHEELGEPIDIHTGGIDHIPVHHTNEIAQSESAYGHKLANYWLHCNFITIDSKKISKSLGNTYTLRDLADRGFSPLDFKMWVLQGHYQSERNFSFDDLTAAKQRRLNWRNRIARLIQQPFSNYNFNQSDFITILNNNLNSPEAFAYIDNHTLNLDHWHFIDKIFGLNLNLNNINKNLLELIAAREQARKDKDFVTADRLRDELTKNNLTILDTKTGPIWQYLS